MNERMPKVSVCVITYNHEKYIRECLQSLVEQKVDFNFEIIISDDCSTDSTRQIILEFASRYPHLIHAHFHEKNLGPSSNYMFAHAAARGEYIAHMDGDDYALPGKLKAQADYLDENPDLVIAWHRMKVLDAKSGRVVDDLLDVSSMPPGGFTREEIAALGSIGCHSAKMYRSCARLLEAPDFTFLDFYVDVEQLSFGRAGINCEILGVYRANVGMSSQSFRTRKILIENLNQLKCAHVDLRRAICTHFLRLFISDVRHSNPTLKETFGGLLRNFHILSIYDLLSMRKFYRIFRSPL